MGSDLGFLRGGTCGHRGDAASVADVSEGSRQECGIHPLVAALLGGVPGPPRAESRALSSGLPIAATAETEVRVTEQQRRHRLKSAPVRVGPATDTLFPAPAWRSFPGRGDFVKQDKRGKVRPLLPFPFNRHPSGRSALHDEAR